MERDNLDMEPPWDDQEGSIRTQRTAGAIVVSSRTQAGEHISTRLLGEALI
jgi:hypothetical protein